MPWWKKALIYLGIALFLYGAGIGTAYLATRSSIADLRERAKYITEQYNEAVEAELAATETIVRLEQHNRETEATIDKFAEGFARLTVTNSQLAGRVSELEGTIASITEGLSGLADSTTESGRLLQDSLRILLTISERNGKAGN